MWCVRVDLSGIGGHIRSLATGWKDKIADSLSGITLQMIMDYSGKLKVRREDCGSN